MNYVVALAALIVAGCVSYAPAPVVERGAPAAAPSVPVAGEGRSLYTVKKGDTLYSIALEQGHDYKDIVAWNNIENPNRIQPGQQLRVAPREGEAPVAVVKPVVSAAPLEAKPAGANTETFKREPKGGKVAYSEEGLARMRERGYAPDQQAAPPAEKPAEGSPRATTEGSARGTPAPAGDDAIDWAWPAPGKIILPYTEGGAGKETNRGIDIAGKPGEPVLAAASGTVTYVGSGIRGYGNFAIVRHNAAYLSVYANNSRILVKEYQKVLKGQKIAEIGSPDADQVKLHFEIRHLGKPADPIKYLPAR